MTDVLVDLRTAQPVASMLVISEIFGPTLQGEGPRAGRRVAFVRLGRCNLDCGASARASWRCDTPYTWDWQGKLGAVHDPSAELHRIAVDDVVRQVLAMGVRSVVVTGGEPLLQLSAVTHLSERLSTEGCSIEIETNGTRTPTTELADVVTGFNVSPKLSSSGIELDRRIVPKAIAALEETGRAHWKFVVADRSELDEVTVLQDRFGLEQVWIMAAGTTIDEQLRRMSLLADDVVKRGWNLTPRLHVLLWGDERGR